MQRSVSAAALPTHLGTDARFALFGVRSIVTEWIVSSFIFFLLVLFCFGFFFLSGDWG